MAKDQGYFNSSLELVPDRRGRASRPGHRRVARRRSYGSRPASWDETACLHHRTVSMAHLRWQMGVPIRAETDPDTRWRYGCRPGCHQFSSLGSIVRGGRWRFCKRIYRSLGAVGAYAVDGNSPVQAGGFLALFGAWSLVMCVINLVPFRTKDNYSEGAQIYQLLSNGPWADLHRAFSVAGSSLVTPLRPRNYDIQAIVRAGRAITQGRQGLLLRLLAYNDFLDLGRIPEAAEA